MTILEFARTHNITKNKAKYYIKQLSADMTYKDDKGRIHITEQGIAELLKTAFKTDFKLHQEPNTTTEQNAIIEHLKAQITSLEKDKEYLQELLYIAEKRADYLTIQTLPFFKRRKALKDYNQRMLLTENKQGE